tara:strand:+ start:1953 stop:3335 length:1383 start_codon:yes stop_codon:yes gene_type:complete
MSLSSSVKTKEIEAVYYQQNGRVEFRFQPNKLYSTDVIISNLGVSKSANQTQLSKWCGVYGCVTNATLFDGNTELSNISDVGFWSGFKMFKKENQFSESVSQYYNGGNLGKNWNQSDTNTNCVASAGVDNFGAKMQDADLRDLDTLDTESGTFKGQLKLRELFDILNKMSYIDTSIFKNFRVVLELSNLTNRILKGRQDDVGLNTTRPFMVAHEVVDEEILSNMMGRMGNIVYTEMEDDSVQIPAITGLTNASRYKTQINNYHLNSFNNKSLGRILLWKQPADAGNHRDVTADGSVKCMGIYNSDVFLQEIEQIRINGRNVLARSGIEGSGNRKLAHMVDSWGVCSLAPLNSGLANSAPDGIPRQRILDNGNADIGALDFVGLDLGGEKCTDLQIDLTRTGIFLATVAAGGAGATDGFYANDANRTTASTYNSIHNLAIWCEVTKALVMSKDGSYNVVYV